MASKIIADNDILFMSLIFISDYKIKKTDEIKMGFQGAV